MLDTRLWSPQTYMCVHPAHRQALVHVHRSTLAQTPHTQRELVQENANALTGTILFLKNVSLGCYTLIQKLLEASFLREKLLPLKLLSFLFLCAL